MATFDSVSPQAHVIDTPNVVNFVPELWSDEVIATYKSNLVMSPLVRKLSMQGKKGDTIHIPKMDRDTTASQKTAETAVTLVDHSDSETVVTIDRHFEYSIMIEDSADAQALSSMRRFYTDQAGYALAKEVDTTLLNLGVGLGSGGNIANVTSAAHWGASDAVRMPTNADGDLGAFTGTNPTDDFTDVTFRDALQVLDDNDVPLMGRSFVICPGLVNTIRGITEWKSADFVGGPNNTSTQTGEIGNAYGVKIYVSSNVPNISSGRMNTLFHKDAYVLAEQIGVRSQMQYKQEHLSTLYTADRLYGRQVYRPENGLVIVTV